MDNACRCGAVKELPRKDGSWQLSAEDGYRDLSEVSYGAWGQAGPLQATGAAGNRPRPPMHYLSLILGGEPMVGGSSVAKELQNGVRLRREPRDPDRVLARRMQPPEAGGTTSRRVFPHGFPPHASTR